MVSKHIFMYCTDLSIENIKQRILFDDTFRCELFQDLMYP